LWYSESFLPFLCGRHRYKDHLLVRHRLAHRSNLSLSVAFRINCYHYNHILVSRLLL
jgi:hypothetical protein